jgi:multiple sugar transport system permease protein
MSTTTEPAPAPSAGTPRRRPATRGRLRRLTRGDKLILALLIGVPTIVHIGLVWVPTLGSVVLSFARWEGLGGFDTIEWIGWQNYQDIFEIYPPFWPAVRHNLIWLGFLLVVPTTLALLLAYLLDKNLKGTRIYQSAIFLPVVLSLALVGFIWELMYKPDGLVNNLFSIATPGTVDKDWLADSGTNLWAVMIAASWRHVGYVMIIFLAGLKSVDPSLRESSALDGANEWQTFRHVVFPAMRPVNIVVLVITIIEALRAYDLVVIINGGKNGLELVSVLVTDNIIGEASRIGYGSALAVILLLVSLIVIIPYLYRVFREDLRR